MSYFKLINYDNGGEGAIHFENILSSDEKQMFLAIRFCKLYSDKHRGIECCQTLDVDTIDQLIEQLQVAKQNILKYNAGQSTTNNPQDHCWDKQYEMFRSRFNKQKSLGIWSLFE